jgi:hypothetical protein
MFSFAAGTPNIHPEAGQTEFQRQTIQNCSTFSTAKCIFQQKGRKLEFIVCGFTMLKLRREINC